jgi:hypothetical protein
MDKEQLANILQAIAGAIPLWLVPAMVVWSALEKNNFPRLLRVAVSAVWPLQLLILLMIRMADFVAAGCIVFPPKEEDQPK